MSPISRRPYGYTHEPWTPRVRPLRRDWFLAVLPGVLSALGFGLLITLSMDGDAAQMIASFCLMGAAAISAVIAFATFAKRGHLVSGFQVAVLGLSLLLTLPAVAVLVGIGYLALK